MRLPLIAVAAVASTLTACGAGGAPLDASIPDAQPMVAKAVLSWAASAGGAEETRTFANAVASHAKGWSAVVGIMSAKADLYEANGQSGGTLEAPEGDFGSYLARYETDGQLGWARRIHSDSTCAAVKVAILSDGTISVIGYFTGTLTLSDKDLGEDEVTLESEGDEDVFVARYTSSGALQWGRRLGGTGGDQGLCVCAGDDGSAIVGGLIEGSVTFGAAEAHDTKLASRGRFDGFLAKLQSDGDLEWARTFQSESEKGYSIVWTIASDSDARVVVGGNFTGSGMTVDSNEEDDRDADALDSTGSAPDVFVAKFTKDGALSWQRSAGGEQQDDLRGVAISPTDGEVFVTGGFYGKATFEKTTLDTTDATAENAFVASYDKEGRLRWATQSDGPVAKRGAIGLSLAVDSNGGAVVVGWFRDTIAGFGGSSHKLKSEGAHDVFIVRFNPGKSTVDWAITAGTGSDEAGITGVSIIPAKKDVKQSLVLCGYFVGSATFGLGEANETTLSGNGTYDACVVKFTPDGK